jgi:uncharacterized GH25 family protein
MEHARSTRWLATSIVLITLTSSLGAHDFWLEPSAFDARVGDPVRVHLRVGERFLGEPVVRNESRIERFVVAGPGGERPVIGREGMDPAGLLRLDAPGIWYVGYRSRPAPVQLGAAAFERYLREEGLERIIEDRAARKESQLPGREQFSRSVKALLRAGAAAGAPGYDRVLGLPLEFVLEADPLRSPESRVPVRLLLDGKPLLRALVVAYRKDSKASEGAEAFRGRTDAEGRVVLPVMAGQWLVKAVHMERAAPNADADWNSVWTALTFDVPGATR